MPAWFYVVAVAAVLFVAWVAFARRWAHAVWYSWTRARHLADLTETEVTPGAEYIPYVEVSGAPPWPLDWREQTRVELAPETLDLLAAPPREFLATIPGTRMTIWDDGEVEFTEEPADPGPGGDARLSTTPSPGPDQDPPLSCAVMHGPEGCPGYLHPREPTRLAGTGDLAAAHEAHPSPDWLAAQMADLFAWVRAMVPQVTGWSVGA